jgi:hypothetical protein
MHILSKSNGLLENVTFNENLAKEGAAIKIEGKSVVHAHNITCSNHQSLLTGGVVYVASESNLNMSNIISKDSFSRIGGFLHVEDKGSVFISGLYIEQCNAEKNGGVFFNY